MTDYPLSDRGLADPTTEAFWAACEERRLTVQACGACGHRQMYPRAMCLHCGATDALSMEEVSGRGVIYSVTTIRIPVTEELAPPYLLALVDLEEGPRLLTNVLGESAGIGDAVTLDWRERAEAPPVPVFRRVED